MTAARLPRHRTLAARRLWLAFDLIRASTLVAAGVLLIAAGIPW